MKAITKKLVLSQKEYYETHLNIINAVLPIKLTPMEIVILAGFMCLDGTIAKDRFGTSARKIVMEEYKLSPGGLGNYMKAFRDKQIIIEKENTTVIHPLLMANKSIQDYYFKLENND